MKLVDTIRFYIVILLTVFVAGCTKDEGTVVLSTSVISQITKNTAVSGGNIKAVSGSSVSKRGVCWDTLANPTIDNFSTTDSFGIGKFNSILTNLKPKTTYYIRSYAIAGSNINYGNELNFTTLDTIISPKISLPTLLTLDATDITTSKAVLGGTITTDGNSPILTRGVCWSILASPTISASKTIDTLKMIGNFKTNVSNLSPNTTYFVRAFATNNVGIAYGNEIQLTTLAKSTDSVVYDTEGNEYNIVKIGTQTWMKENLKVTKYNNGDAIGTTALDTLTEAQPKYQWPYNATESKVATYGRLYTYDVTTDSRKVCPTGWHIPTDTEWTVLTDYLTANGFGNNGTGTEIAKSMAAKSGWNSYFSAGTIGNDIQSNNKSNFSALAGGLREANGAFYPNGFIGIWWSATEVSTNTAWYRSMYYSENKVTRASIYSKKTGCSVRCVKD